MEIAEVILLFAGKTQAKQRQQKDDEARFHGPIKAGQGRLCKLNPSLSAARRRQSALTARTRQSVLAWRDPQDSFAGLRERPSVHLAP